MFTEKVISSKQFTKSIPKRKVGLGYSDCQGFTPNVLWIKFSIFIIRWILRKLPIFLHNLVDILYTYISTLQGSEIYALNHV